MNESTWLLIDWTFRTSGFAKCPGVGEGKLDYSWKGKFMVSLHHCYKGALPQSPVRSLEKHFGERKCEQKLPKKHYYRHFLKLYKYQDFLIIGSASVPTASNNRRSIAHAKFITQFRNYSKNSFKTIFRVSK